MFCVLEASCVVYVCVYVCVCVCVCVCMCVCVVRVSSRSVFLWKGGATLLGMV